MRPYHHGDLREKLIAATEALILERGVDGFSLREVARHPQRCVIVVTHDNRVFKYADRMTEMEDGRVERVHESYGQYEKGGKS